MQPLTFRKLLFHCLLLLIILFLVVVVALKFGAVPVSLYASGGGWRATCPVPSSPSPT